MSSGSADPLSTSTRTLARTRQECASVVAVDARHAQIHHDDVGIELAGKRDRLAAVECPADDLDPLVAAEDQLERLSKETLVICTSTRVTAS